MVAPVSPSGILPASSFVVRPLRLAYVSVTKNACTSLRWMVADLAGEDPARFHRATAAHQSRLMTIHTDRATWRRTPSLGDLDETERAGVHPDRGWLVLAVTRDPWTRLWSAWQSKFLVRHSHYLATYGEEPWFPRVPRVADDVVEDFARFVEHAPWERHARLSRDTHFRTQVEAIRPETVPYSRIYDLAEMSTLVRDVEAHVRAHGHDAPLYLPRANETPLRPTRAVLGGGVAERISASFAADLDVFGDRWDLERLSLAPDGWSDDALAHVRFHTVANQRIGDLAAETRRLRKRVRRLESGQEAERSGATPASVVRRVRDRLRPSR